MTASPPGARRARHAPGRACIPPISRRAERSQPSGRREWSAARACDTVPRVIPAPRRTALRRRLLAWYDAGHRDLPWRRPQGAADPYRVWIAEVMLQQTQVATAIPYYRRFVARFPTLASLAAAREGEVLALWSGLGYYARARNLHAAARTALRRHGGLPASLEALEALPGFGPYTAGAVASIAFGIPAAAVDGNVARVLARLFLVEGDPARAPVRNRLSALAAELVEARRAPEAQQGRGAIHEGAERRAALGSAGRLEIEAGRAAPARRPGDLNQALMELGATVCAKRAPACGRCPVASLCAARAAGRTLEVPRARRRPARRPLVIACAVVRRGDAILLTRRPPGGLFAGLFAPPMAEVGPGGDPRAALVRALGDAGILGRVGAGTAGCERLLTHRALTLRAFACDVVEGFRPPRGFRFARPGQLGRTGVPAAMRELLGWTRQIPDSA